MCKLLYTIGSAETRQLFLFCHTAVSRCCCCAQVFSTHHMHHMRSSNVLHKNARGERLVRQKRKVAPNGFSGCTRPLISGRRPSRRRAYPRPAASERGRGGETLGCMALCEALLLARSRILFSMDAFVATFLLAWLCLVCVMMCDTIHTRQAQPSNPVPYTTTKGHPATPSPARIWKQSIHNQSPRRC